MKLLLAYNLPVLMRNLIIKPCTENSKIVELRTTQLEWVLYPFQFEQSWDSKAVSSMMWHSLHDILQTCSHRAYEWDDGKPRESAYRAAMIINNHHLEFWKAQLGKYKPTIDDKIRFFVHNLELWTIVAKWLELYTKKIATEVSLGMWVECGEYRVWLTWTLDILEDDCLCDPKYYGKLREWWNIRDEYNKDNYLYTWLAEKTQRFVYPYLLYGPGEDRFFIYDVFDKTKKMKHERIKCRVNMEWAEGQIKKNLIQYFKILRDTNQLP